MKTVLAIAVGGALGALARYGLGTAVTSRTGTGFPWGTFVVNVSGAFVVGLLFVLFTEWFDPAEWLRAGLTIGFLGAYTTFSTLALDSVLLAEDARLGAAAFNALGSLAAGLVAVVAGWAVGRLFTD
jgi:fluoride exporter